MSYNGSGTFNINSAGQPVVTGTVISSTAFNALTADLGTGLSTAITKDGQTVATARIPFAAGINSSLVTDATSTTTGSIITAGGVGIAKALFVGTTLNVAGASTLAAITGTFNGTVGATTPSTGAFTTLTSTLDATIYGVTVGRGAGAVSTNTAVGASALAINSTGANNTALGNTTLSLNTAGANNTAVGATAGKVSTGSNNTFIGSDAGETTTTGTFNTFLGRLSGYLVTSGSKNTIIGSYTGSAAPISATGSNYVVLSDGDGNVRGTFDSSGNLLVGTTSGTADKATFAAATTTTNVLAMVSTDDSSGGLFAVFRNSAYTSIGNIARVTTTNAVVYNTTSDYRLKTVVGAVTGQGERIDALKPIDYHWIDGGEQARGFLAHEFQEVYANSVTGEKDAVDDNGKPIHQAMQASTPEVIADLVAELQSLRKRITALEAK